MTQEFQHTPVMVSEVLSLFEPIPAGVVVDATVGGGGHAEALLGALPDHELVGLDTDDAAVAESTAASGRVRGSGAGGESSL